MYYNILFLFAYILHTYVIFYVFCAETICIITEVPVTSGAKFITHYHQVVFKRKGIVHPKMNVHSCRSKPVCPQNTKEDIFKNVA